MKTIFSLTVLTFFMAVVALRSKNKKPTPYFLKILTAAASTAANGTWRLPGNTVNDEQQAYVDSSSVLYMVHGKDAEGAKNGALVIKAIYHPGYTSKEQKKYDFLSGRINTRKKMEFTYGTASARMKIASGAGMWPAFWALGKASGPIAAKLI